MFAANAGKKAGEFYTPHEVSVLMSDIIAHHLRNRQTIKIYDPTSGSGSLLINIGNSIAKHLKDKDSIKYYAQELKENTYNLTRMNLVMRDINPSNILTRNADTLEDDWPYFDDSDPVGTYEPLYVDAVVSNPPYSQAWDTAGKTSDPRYAGFGLAPKINQNWGVFGEVGAYYTGNPSVNLTATGLQEVGGSTSGQTAADNEARKIANDDKYEWMPVAKLGVSYHF